MFGIRSVEEREAGRGELHARVEVTRLSSFKAFSSARAWDRMNWRYSILCRLGTVWVFYLAVKPHRARDH